MQLILTLGLIVCPIGLACTMLKYPQDFADRSPVFEVASMCVTNAAVILVVWL
jgi:hypothetical protein